MRTPSGNADAQGASLRELLPDAQGASLRAALSVGFRKCRPTAQAPLYATAGAAGADLRVCLEQEVWVQPGERALIPTGIALALPPGCLGLVFARSGLAWRSGLALANGVGVIDSDYRGEIMVPVINLGTEPVRLEPGDRIAQIVICEGGRALFGELPALERTERGAGGFGSSGVK